MLYITKRYWVVNKGTVYCYKVQATCISILCLLGMGIILCDKITFLFLRHWDYSINNGSNLDILNVNFIYTCLHIYLVFYECINTSHFRPFYDIRGDFFLSVLLTLTLTCINIWAFSASPLKLLKLYGPNLVCSKYRGRT